MIWLRLLHHIGLTNLSLEQINQYGQMKNRKFRHIRTHGLLPVKSTNTYQSINIHDSENSILVKSRDSHYLMVRHDVSPWKGMSVFISYSKFDTDVVSHLSHSLEDEGFRISLQHEHLKTDDIFKDVKSMMENSEVSIIVFSKKSEKDKVFRTFADNVSEEFIGNKGLIIKPLLLPINIGRSIIPRCSFEIDPIEIDPFPLKNLQKVLLNTLINYLKIFGIGRRGISCEKSEY